MDQKNTALNDPYWNHLQERWMETEAADREADQKIKEATEQKARTEEQRKQIAVARAHYAEHLRQRGIQVPDIEEVFAPAESPTGPITASTIETPEGDDSHFPDDLVLRAGPKRLAVLEALAYLTAQKGWTTNRDIRRRTNQKMELITNVIYADVKRNLVERRNDRVRMLPLGYEFLRRLGSPAGNANDPSITATPSVKELLS